MYMSDVELYKTLPFAGGVAMARYDKLIYYFFDLTSDYHVL